MKIVISGYYGHGNFGDEAILRAITDELEKTFNGPEITVLSKIPDLREIARCDLFISGGGSLLQDVTSLKSLVYYLGLLYLAILLKKKTVVYSQGIGPLNSKAGKKPAGWVLKKVDFVSVRDDESAKLLKSLGIEPTITADPAWGLEYNPVKTQKERIQIGIQLRQWPLLNSARLKTLANAVNSVFRGQDPVINLISLQDKKDGEVLSAFGEMVEGVEVKLLEGLTLERAIDCISNLDCLIAMRYHACLVAAGHDVPFLAIAYDPKVKSLAREANVPYIAVKDMNFSMLSNGIKYLMNEKDRVSANLRELSAEKREKAGMGAFLERFR